MQNAICINDGTAFNLQVSNKIYFKTICTSTHLSEEEKCWRNAITHGSWFVGRKHAAQSVSPPQKATCKAVFGRCVSAKPPPAVHTKQVNSAWHAENSESIF